MVIPLDKCHARVLSKASLTLKVRNRAHPLAVLALQVQVFDSYFLHPRSIFDQTETNPIWLVLFHALIS